MSQCSKAETNSERFAGLWRSQCTTTSGGGYTIQAAYERQFIAAMKQFDPILDISRNANGDLELLTLPVKISPSVAAIGTGNKSVLLGDLSYFVVRRVLNSVRVQRFGETYAEVGQVGFAGFVRISSGLAKATGADNPVKFITHS